MPTSIMITQTDIHQLAEDIISSIPLQAKQVQGWAVLYNLCSESDSLAHRKVSKLVSKAAPLAYDALAMSESLAYLQESATPIVQYILVHQIMGHRSKLKEYALQIRKILLEDVNIAPINLPQELADSDVIRFWMKRYRIKLINNRKETE